MNIEYCFLLGKYNQEKMLFDAHLGNFTFDHFLHTPCIIIKDTKMDIGFSNYLEVPTDEELGFKLVLVSDS